MPQNKTYIFKIITKVQSHAKRQKADLKGKY